MRGAHAPPAGAHLLLVEDDPALREVVVEVLTDAGYRAHGAADGAAALALLAGPDAPPVGAVLLDLRLPDMDGPAFAAAYRRLPGRPRPAARLHGRAPAEAAAAADRLGAAGVVPKPFDLDDLLAAVGRCLPAPGPPARRPWRPPPRRRGGSRTRTGASWPGCRPGWGACGRRWPGCRPRSARWRPPRPPGR